MTKPNVPDAIMTTGWSNGIAAKLSLPNILLPPLRRDGSHMTRRNVIEQTLAHLPVGLHSICLGWLDQFLKCIRVEDSALRLCSADPILKGICPSRHKIKTHVGEAIATELR